MLLEALHTECDDLADLRDMEEPHFQEVAAGLRRCTNATLETRRCCVCAESVLSATPVEFAPTD